MTNVTDMLWVTEHSISSMGKNTIRLNQPKYDNILPGDVIRLHLVVTPESDPFMVEELQVRSIVKGVGMTVIYEFGWNSHLFDYKNGDDCAWDVQSLAENLHGIYGSLDQTFKVFTFF